MALAGAVEPSEVGSSGLAPSQVEPARRLFRMGETGGGKGWGRWGWAVLVTVLVHTGAAAFVGLSALRAPSEAPARPEEPELVFLAPAPPRAAAGARVARQERVARPARVPAPRPALVPPQPSRLPEVAPAPVEPAPVVEEAVAQPEVSEEASCAEVGLSGVGGVVAGIVGGALDGVEGSVLGATGGTALDVKQVSRRPEVLKQVTPQYPRRARSEGIEGVVLVRIIIGTDGLVEEEHTRVIRSVPELDAAAISAVNRWRFTPALGRQGRPVRVVIDVPLQFSLK
ncbi:energy transducer TonB [Archangium lipolyticum]|uniref:energy transducer TonB n=1 Tax=Archangium lipolyticum TaxID=2970465 RepID=UPI0021499FF7|nr:energy transducer TonB [Archangium lipolyticum]